jgi:hypothetical protein
MKKLSIAALYLIPLLISSTGCTTIQGQQEVIDKQNKLIDLLSIENVTLNESLRVARQKGIDLNYYDDSIQVISKGDQYTIPAHLR